MRMWMIDPQCLCRKHLLGEHLECGHMLPGAINKKKIGSLRGLARDGFIQVRKIKERHEFLVEEMNKRGYNHKSPLAEFNISNLPKEILNATVNIKKSINDLSLRCKECRERIYSNA